jgi:outer membrane protein OmpA-like peptidoglycan-associated protein
MNKSSSLTALTLACLLLAVAVISATAQDTPQDAEGCKDSPLIQRMPGSHINACDHKEFDSVKMPIAKDADGNLTEKTVEGETWTWDMGNREGLSDVQVFRNFLNALKQANWTVDYAQDQQITAHKGVDYIFLDNMNGSFYYQTVVHQKEMQQEVIADAGRMAAELAQSGHVAVYGIHFPSGQATIQADSEPTLNQIVELLKSDPNLKLRVEGHTDNTGSKDANKTLSQQRAAAVVAWLSQHGIDRARLTAAGFGDTRPVADNSTDEGKAKNRRVELVKE